MFASQEGYYFSINRLKTRPSCCNTLPGCHFQKQVTQRVFLPTFEK